MRIVFRISLEDHAHALRLAHEMEARRRKALKGLDWKAAEIERSNKCSKAVVIRQCLVGGLLAPADEIPIDQESAPLGIEVDQNIWDAIFALSIEREIQLSTAARLVFISGLAALDATWKLVVTQ